MTIRSPFYSHSVCPKPVYIVFFSYSAEHKVRLKIISSLDPKHFQNIFFCVLQTKISHRFRKAWEWMVKELSFQSGPLLSKCIYDNKSIRLMLAVWFCSGWTPRARLCSHAWREWGERQVKPRWGNITDPVIMHTYINSQFNMSCCKQPDT